MICFYLDPVKILCELKIVLLFSDRLDPNLCTSNSLSWLLNIGKIKDTIVIQKNQTGGVSINKACLIILCSVPGTTNSGVPSCPYRKQVCFPVVQSQL